TTGAASTRSPIFLWVHYVTKELRRRYEHKFGSSMDEIELVTWLKTGDWQEQLCEHTSLAEFAEKQCMRRRCSS
ncbi:hypothetical protein MTO96_046309, partial [Rhipicephalus appendiculatus]